VAGLDRMFDFNLACRSGDESGLHWLYQTLRVIASFVVVEQ
jgi:hypothetical protein